MNTRHALTKDERRKKEQEEEEQKLKCRQEIAEIEGRIKNIQKDIKEQNYKLQQLFIKSNSKMAILRNYVIEVSKEIYKTSDLVDEELHKADIPKLTNEIMQMIENIQDKIKYSFEFTKAEMQKETEEKYKEKEKQWKAREDEFIMRKLQQNFECQQLQTDYSIYRIAFDDDSFRLEKHFTQNKLLKTEYLDLKKDHQTLLKNLLDIQTENQQLKQEYDNLFIQANKSSVEENQSHQNESLEIKHEHEEESKLNKPNHRSQSQLPSYSHSQSVIDEPSSIPKKEVLTPQSINPKLLISNLKSIIKDMMKEERQISEKCVEEKTKKNETLSLLKKCIDDVNLQNNKTGFHYHKALLPKIENKITKANKTTSSKFYQTPSTNNKNNKENTKEYQITKNKEIQVTMGKEEEGYIPNKTLKILTYIYDNTLMSIKERNLYIPKKSVIKKRRMNYKKYLFDDIFI